MTSTKTFLHDKKIALVYDWFDSWGGSERVLLTLDQMLPDADWYTSYVNFDTAPWAKDLTSVHTSFIHQLPFVRKSRILSAPLYPFAFESFDFGAYDLVISVTSSYAKGIVTRPETTHVCYMLTPTRFLWIKEKEYLREGSLALLKPYTDYLKNWDQVAAERPDNIIGISQTVADRIGAVYERTADVIYPPFDIEYWELTLRRAEKPSGEIPSSYYVVVSRLRPYKKVDLAIRAFRKMNDKNLIVVGSGSNKDLTYLKSLAGSNITFMNNLTDHELAWIYGHAHGLIMPQEEDFGYTSLEAQICSCPVISFNKGGATETVKHGLTGYLFDTQSARGIREAVEKFEPTAYNIQRHLQKAGTHEVQPFAKETFINTFSAYLTNI